MGLRKVRNLVNMSCISASTRFTTKCNSGNKKEQSKCHNFMFFYVYILLNAFYSPKLSINERFRNIFRNENSYIFIIIYLRNNMNIKILTWMISLYFNLWIILNKEDIIYNIEKIEKFHCNTFASQICSHVQSSGVI